MSYANRVWAVAAGFAACAMAATLLFIVHAWYFAGAAGLLALVCVGLLFVISRGIDEAERGSLGHQFDGLTSSVGRAHGGWTPVKKARDTTPADVP